MALGEGLRIEPEDMPDRIRHMMITEEPPHYSAAGKAGEQLLIEKALFNFEGDKTRAARFIGWTRTEAEKMHPGSIREVISWGQQGWRVAD